MVYKTPPMTSNITPLVGTLVIMWFHAKTINHPMIMYMTVEKNKYFLTKNDLNTVPPMANPQTIPNNVHPTHPFTAMKRKGVYVPAIKK